MYAVKKSKCNSACQVQNSLNILAIIVIGCNNVVSKVVTHMLFMPRIQQAHKYVDRKNKDGGQEKKKKEHRKKMIF